MGVYEQALEMESTQPLCVGQTDDRVGMVGVLVLFIGYLVCSIRRKPIERFDSSCWFV